MVPSNTTRSNGHKLKGRRFWVNNRKHCFTVKVIEHWLRFPTEAVEFPSLEIFGCSFLENKNRSKLASRVRRK